MNQTIELLRRTRELLADIQTELVTLTITEEGRAFIKPRKRSIKAKINGGGK